MISSLPQLFDLDFADKVSEVHDYGYGWEKDCLTDYPNDFVQGGSHSEAVMIACWMRDLKKTDSISICGAFDGECIEDLEIALSSLDLPFKRIESLIV